MESENNIKHIEDMLSEYRRLYSLRHPPRVEPPPYPLCGHDIIHKAINYGINTCRSAIILLENSQSENAAIITRPFLELALRIVWCKQYNNGWQRLVAYYAKETLDAVKAEEGIEGINPISQKATDILNQLSIVADSKLPNLLEMLDTIAKKQENLNVMKNIKQTYTVFFKGSLHQLAHANLTYMAFNHNPLDPFRIQRAIKRASFWIINSSHTYIDMTPEDMKKFIDKFSDGFQLI